MRLILITLFVFVSSVIICVNGSDQFDVQGRYNFNHPPGADYNPIPIPVAVVYEDDAKTGKAIKSDSDLNIEEISQTTEEPITTKLTTQNTDSKKSVTNNEQDDVLVKPKGRALSGFQIPVAVVYDAPDSIPLQTNTSDVKNNRRRVKVRRRKPLNKTSIITKKDIVQSTEPTILRSQTKSIFKPRSTIDKQIPEREDIIETNTNYRKQGKRERDPVVPIINSENYVFAHSGNFHYSYEGGDGTRAHSEGQLMRDNNDNAAGEAVSGGFSYTDKEGNDFSLSYTADERGYRPVGAHLPTSPPIPPAIARALAYLATATTPEPVTKPSKT